MIQEVLDDGEKILWQKEFPPQNVLPNKGAFTRYIGIFLIFYLPLVVFSLILLFIPTVSIILKFLLVILSIVLGGLFRYLVFGAYKEINKYNNMKKIFPDEILQNYRESYFITNKNVIRGWIDEWSNEFDNDYLEKLKHFARFEKDFLILNHQYLRKITSSEFRNKYDAYLYFSSPDVNEKLDLIDFEFEQLSLEELNEFIKTLSEICKDVIINH